MSLSVVRTCALDGVCPRPVDVEVHVGRGLPSMSIVGLPQSSVRESKDRVRAALDHLGFSVPQVRVTVNLAPADVPKRGGAFDLPIAIGLLAASGQLPSHALENRVFVGELGLGGELRAARGVLPIALALAGSSADLVLPDDNREEACLSTRTRVVSASSLAELHALLRRDIRARHPSPHRVAADVMDGPDMIDVRGQVMARRALEIAAAGEHSLLMCGPPGSGKSMLARRLVGIRPPLTEREAIEAASIASVAHGGFNARHWRQRPFRAPHHTASSVALIGGGSRPSPGEVSLAHNGVLFLDELVEFSRPVLEVLREPLETGQVTVSRAARQADFPARFQLVAAMNPCPCGYGLEAERCRCRPDDVRRYQSRLSGPLLDRIDLVINMQPARSEALAADCAAPESSATVRKRVLEAVASRQSRGETASGPDAEERCAALDAGASVELRNAVTRLGLSRRARWRVIRIARTIADLDGVSSVTPDHVAESLAYRGDRGFGRLNTPPQM